MIFPISWIFQLLNLNLNDLFSRNKSNFANNFIPSRRIIIFVRHTIFVSMTTLAALPLPIPFLSLTFLVSKQTIFNSVYRPNRLLNMHMLHSSPRLLPLGFINNTRPCLILITAHWCFIGRRPRRRGAITKSKPLPSSMLSPPPRPPMHGATPLGPFRLHLIGLPTITANTLALPSTFKVWRGGEEDSSVKAQPLFGLRWGDCYAFSLIPIRCSIFDHCADTGPLCRAGSEMARLTVTAASVSMSVTLDVRMFTTSSVRRYNLPCTRVNTFPSDPHRSQRGHSRNPSES